MRQVQAKWALNINLWRNRQKHRNCKQVKGVTFTILSAYFINQETKSPVEPRFNTTSQVVKLYPLKSGCHHGPFSNSFLKSSKRSRAILKIAPNLEKYVPFWIISSPKLLITTGILLMIITFHKLESHNILVDKWACNIIWCFQNKYIQFSARENNSFIIFCNFRNWHQNATLCIPR